MGVFFNRLAIRRLELEGRALYVELGLQAAAEAIQDVRGGCVLCDHDMCRDDIGPLVIVQTRRSCAARAPGASRMCFRTRSTSTSFDVASSSTSITSADTSAAAEPRALRSQQLDQGSELTSAGLLGRRRWRRVAISVHEPRTDPFRFRAVRCGRWDRDASQPFLVEIEHGLHRLSSAGVSASGVSRRLR